MSSEKFVNPHPEGCFWYEAAEKYGAPDIKYCEETLCQFVSEPANTWSNFSFILVGLAVYFYQRRLNDQTTPRFVQYYGINMVFVGVTSFLYHLSNNFLTQYIDFLGMYAFFGFLLFGNLERLGSMTRQQMIPWYVISFIPFSIVLFLFRHFGFPIQASIGIVILGCLYTLFKVMMRFRFSLKIFLACASVFILAVTCQILDIKRIFCDPHNHWFQLHAMWHVFNGIAMGIMFFLFKGIKERES